MTKRRIVFIALAGLLAGGLGAWAQSSSQGGTNAVQGFNVPSLIGQLSLYLPPEATQGMYGGRSAAAGGQRQQLQFTRDPALFLTKDQIAKLLPILTALRESPLPTPSKATQVRADVDGILTAAQKAEYEQFRKAMQDLIQRYRQQAAANAAGSGGEGSGQNRQFQGGGENSGTQMTPLQRRQRQLDAFIKVLQSRQELGG
ncbi:MAG: hypothetical protein ABSB63_20425 [Spirochaetia bacterium]